MNIQHNLNLSQKSRGILYRFKKRLTSKKITLKQIVCKLFGFLKNSFSSKQFYLLIIQFDEKLIPKDIAELFEDLDECKNQVVFYQTIQYALEHVSEQYNPSLVLNRKSKSVEDTNKRQQINMVIDLKDLLLQSQDYLQVIHIFATQKDGFLTKQNIIQLMKNFEFTNNFKQNKVIQYVFGSKSKVSTTDFLQKLSLYDTGTRIKIPNSPIKLHQSIIKDEQKSQYIKEIQKQKIRQSTIKEHDQVFKSRLSLNLGMSIDNQTLQYTLQNIPEVLQPYFNYGSQLQQPFARYASQYIKKRIIFIDEENPTYGKAKNWVHIDQINPNYKLFQVAKSIIRRDNSRKGLAAMLEPKDIKQGNIGDCYFLSAVAAIVQEYPELVYRLFVLEKNPSHMFGVKLFIDGAWITIPLDGCFPINYYGKFCGAQPHYNEIWVMLLEKAWAKVYKSYENIVAGYNQEGLLAISGAPSIQVSSKKNGFLKSIIAQFGKGSIITCATSKDVGQLTEKQQQNLGVFAGHAYTLMKVYQNLPFRDSFVTLFKIRNPWGSKSWKGDWSFKSSLWTNQLRKKVGYQVDPQDGSFFVNLSDFVVYFDHINISKVNLAYRNSHITNRSTRYDFYENRLKIKTEGDYFFTLYQQNDRKYKSMSMMYQKSKSWLFLAKVIRKNASNQIQQLLAIACVASIKSNSTIETTLQPGQYVLISKAAWKYWNQHTYTIASYGPDKVRFDMGKVSSPKLISNFIESRCEQISKHSNIHVSVYDNLNISKKYDFSIADGIGFISINNFDNCIFETTIHLEPCKGINVILPYSLPLRLTVLPYQTKTVGLIIDPEGYSCNMKQKIHFQKAY